MKDTLILHLTDLHWNPLQKLPQSAKENYHEIVAKEFLELKNQIEDLKLGYKNIHICISGDLFNLKTQSLYHPKVINYYSQLVEETFKDLKVYCIAGNHDLTQSSFDLIEESAYNIWTKSTKNVIDVNNKTININENLTISGIPYYHLDEAKIKLQDFELNSSKTNIMLLHSDIFKDEKEVDWYLEKFITFEEVCKINSNLDLCLLGHIHKEMPITKISHVKDTWFSKPHAFSRMSKEYLTKKNLEDSYPTYSLIEIENNKIVNIEYKQIKLYESEQFLDFNELEKIKERSSKFNDFIQQIQNSFGTIEESFAVQNADDIYNKMEISKEVKEVINKYIE